MDNALQDNIKRQLQAKNMTAAELERRTGIPHAVVNILHGRSKNPSIKTAQAIAKELGCSLEDLIGVESPIDGPVEQNTNNSFDLQLYTNAFNTLCKRVQAANLNPTAQQMSAWLTDIYTYSSGRTDKVIDERFIQWLLER